VDLEIAAARFSGGVLAIGTFDGVHLAHQALVSLAGERARELGTHLVVLTFDPHPKEFLLPRAPPRLTGLAEKTHRLLAAGAQAVCALAFDGAMAAMSGRQFVEDVLVEQLQARACFVGYNFSFGRGGRGRPEDLRELCSLWNVEVGVLEALDIGDIPVSSTSIRVLLSCGDVAAARERLGRPHRLTGVVVHGDARGRELGFPTANLCLRPSNLLAPGFGVYAGFARLASGETRAAVVNVGVRPTFESDGEVFLEVHCLDYSGGSFYGSEVSLDLIQKLRGERKFSGQEQLKKQIVEDIETARVILDGVERGWE
jgi:riboflavin kinase/FMN adenylyltransferase